MLLEAIRIFLNLEERATLYFVLNDDFLILPGFALAYGLLGQLLGLLLKHVLLFLSDWVVYPLAQDIVVQLGVFQIALRLLLFSFKELN